MWRYDEDEIVDRAVTVIDWITKLLFAAIVVLLFVALAWAAKGGS